MQLVPLPIDAVLPDVVAKLRAASSLVLRAPPGAGKTTRVPPALLDSAWASRGKIVVLQPRRVAARATAARIAANAAGDWATKSATRSASKDAPARRRESRSSPREFCCGGCLDDPFLPDVAAVVFDEFHERSLASDLALAMVRQVQQSVRPELRIVVMSATLEAEPIAAYLDRCPVVESPGRMYPVKIEHQMALDRRPLAESVAEGATQALARTRRRLPGLPAGSGRDSAVREAAGTDWLEQRTWLCCPYMAICQRSNKTRCCSRPIAAK